MSVITGFYVITPLASCYHTQQHSIEIGLHELMRKSVELHFSEPRAHRAAEEKQCGP